MTLTDIASAPVAPSQRGSRRPVVAIVLTVVALLAATAMAGATRRAVGDAPVVPGLFDWPARGSLRGDTALIAKATAAWDGEGLAPELPRRRHTDVSVLYAERVDTDSGIVLLQGRNYLGMPSLGVVLVPPQPGWPYAPPFWEEIPAPSPLLTRQITFLMYTDMTGDGSKVFVLAEPGTTTIAWEPSTDPDALVPMYVVDGVGVADFHNRGIARVVVGNADGTVYDGPAYPLPGVNLQRPMEQNQ